MTTTTFKGARYLVKFSNPIEWDNTRAYEPIEAVQHNGFTYISKQPVPVGVEITNTNFWLLWADPNAQVEQLRQEVSEFDDRITENSIKLLNTVKCFSNVDNMVDYTDAKVGDIYITEGFSMPNDNGGGIYNIVADGEPNGYDLIEINENLYAKLECDDTVNIAQLGAIADTDNDVSAIVNYAVSKYRTIVFNDGTYIFNNEISITRPIKLIGNWHETIIKCYTTNCFIINSRHVQISGFIIYGRDNSATSPNQYAAFTFPSSNNAHMIEISKCWVFLFNKAFTTNETTAMWQCAIEFCRISKCNYGFYFHTTASFSNLFKEVYFDAIYTTAISIDSDFGSEFQTCNIGIYDLANPAINLQNSRLLFTGCNFELDRSTTGSMIKITGYQLTFIGCKFNSTKATAGTVYILDLSEQTNYSNSTFINCGAVYQANGNLIMNPNNNYIKRNQISIIGGANNLTVNSPTNNDVAGICYNLPYNPLTLHSNSSGYNTAATQIKNIGNGVTCVDVDTNKAYINIEGSLKEITTV